MDAMNMLLDLVNVLDLEPGDNELCIEFFDRTVCTARDAGLINESETDLLAGLLERMAT